MLLLTDGETQDVFRGRQSKSELSGVMTDNLEHASETASQTESAEKFDSAAVSERNCCCQERRTCENHGLMRSPVCRSAAARI